MQHEQALLHCIWSSSQLASSLSTKFRANFSLVLSPSSAAAVVSSCRDSLTILQGQYSSVCWISLSAPADPRTSCMNQIHYLFSSWVKLLQPPALRPCHACLYLYLSKLWPSQQRQGGPWWTAIFELGAEMPDNSMQTHVLLTTGQRYCTHQSHQHINEFCPVHIH